MTIEEYLPEWFNPELLSEQAKEEIAICIVDGFLYGTGGFSMTPEWSTSTLTAERIPPTKLRVHVR